MHANLLLRLLTLSINTLGNDLNLELWRRSVLAGRAVKTPGRSRLYDERTADLVLLTYERELTRGLDITEVIKKFGLSEERRVPVID